MAEESRVEATVGRRRTGDDEEPGISQTAPPPPLPTFDLSLLHVGRKRPSSPFPRRLYASASPSVWISPAALQGRTVAVVGSDSPRPRVPGSGGTRRLAQEEAPTGGLPCSRHLPHHCVGSGLRNRASSEGDDLDVRSSAS